MADEDQDAPRPNLEPPALFGRKRRQEQPSAADDEETAVLPVSDPTWKFELPPEPEPPELIQPEPEPEPAAVLPAEAGAPLFADEVDDTPTPAEPRKRRSARAAKPSKPAKAPKQRAPRERKPKAAASSLPTVTGWVAAGLTGVLIGLLMVGMTAGSLQGCEAVRDTSTCGGSGAVILIVIMALLVTLGAMLLRRFHVPDPGSTSFLAVGMVAVIVLLFLLDVVMSWWMLLVIPVISVAMYLLAYWVTTAFVEPAKEPAERA